MELECEKEDLLLIKREKDLFISVCCEEAEKIVLNKIRRLSLWNRMKFLFSPFAMEP